MSEMEIDEALSNSGVFEDISPDNDGSILKTITKQGEGEDHPFTGCKVYVHYVGRLVNGEKFDSSKDRGDVFSFNVGTNSVIKGWDVGVVTMKKNETCELKISPQHAYGEAGFPPKIPENSTLIFEIELLSWEDEDVTKDKGVRKHVIKEGLDISKPKLDSLVKIHIRGMYNGTLFNEEDVEFLIGEGYAHDVVEGVEKAICKMRKHERALVYVKSQYAYKDKGCEKYNIPPNADEIEYDICLFTFERPKEIYEMDYEEKLIRAQTLKDRAVKCIKANEYEKAIEFYERILKFVQINSEDSDYVLGLPFKIASHSNQALCYIKLHDYHNAKLQCNEVISLDGKSVKGYYRLGEAYIGLTEYKHAIQAFESVIGIESENKAAKNQVQHCKQLLKKQTEKEKKMYGNMLFSS